MYLYNTTKRWGSLACGFAALLFCLLASPRAEAQSCPVGTLSVAGVVNTYWAGTGTLAPGATTLTLGTQRAGVDPINGQTAVTTNFAVGDLLLLVQVQDADINITDTTSYGDGVAAGVIAGVTALNSAGQFHFARVTSIGATIGFSPAVPAGVTFRTAAAASAVSGKRAYQVVRVPFARNINVTGTLQAMTWNGATGGIIAAEAGQNLTLGAGANANAVGFRGAGGYEAGSNPTGNPGTEAVGAVVAAISYNGSLTTGATRGRGGKGEGIVGTPRLLDNRPIATLLYGYTTVDQGAANQGYPFTGGFGDFSWGAPGNAGGGGKRHDAGGGGGANAGAGGEGGGAYDTGADHGGYGGAAVAGARMIPGGGGGAANGWHPNNGSILGGGGRGGGLVFLRGDNVTGTATINADGQVGYGLTTGFGGPGGTQLDTTNLRGLGGDGGGAGGSVYVVATTSTLASITANARGGVGGNTGHVGNNRSGAGGGGGGGRVLHFSPVAAPSAVVTGGAVGIQLTTDVAPTALPAAGLPTAGSAGSTATLGGAPGSACAEPDLTLAKTYAGGNVVPGQTGSTYSLVVTNSGSGPKFSPNTVSVVDTLPAGLTATAISGTGWTCVLGTLTCTRTDYLAAGASYPAITLTFSTNANAPNNTTGILTNNANVTLAVQAESSTTNNSASATTPVTAAYKSVRVTNDADGSGVANPTLGDTLTWSVFVSNPVGAATIPAFQVTDALPAGVTITATGAQSIAVVNGACAAPAINATYTGAGVNGLIAAAQTLAADCTIRIDIPTLVTTTGVKSNQPQVSGTGITSFLSDAIDNTTAAAGLPTGVAAGANSLPQTQVAGTRDPTVIGIPGRPTISKAFSAATILAGGTSTLTITVTNPNAAAIGILGVTDTFPTTPAPGVVRAGTPATATTCAGGVVTSTAGSVTLTGGTVPASGSCTFQIDITAALDGSYTNTIAAGALATTVGTNAAPASAVLTVNPNADLALTKSDGGTSVVPGNNVTYTLAVNNIGPSSASGLSVTDTIPAGLVFVSATGTGWACAEAAGVVTCTRATLAVGAAPAITLVLSVPANYAGANPIANSAAITSTSNDPVGGNNTGSDTTPVAAAQADLAITKSDGGSSAVLGGTISYTLAVQNLGPSDAASLSVTDTIPAGLTFNSASGTGWACGEAAGVVTCTRAALAAGATAPPITLVLNVPLAYAGANPIPNSATIGSATADPVAGNNTGSDTTPLLAPPNLALTKSDGGATVAPGGTVAYTLSYSNSSTSAANGVVITETVPANTTFNAGASSAGWACAPDINAGSTCTLAIGTVAGGASGSATYAVTVAASVPAGVTNIANSATVSDDGTGGPDPNPGDNTGSDTTPVNAAPDLTVVKSDGGASVAPGGTVTYTLFFDNNGNQGATGVVLTETVPANTTFNAGASSAGWTCVPNNNAGSTCSLTVGALAALTGAARTFAVTVANPLAAGVTQVANTVSIADDGSNGPDPSPGNNSGSDTTPINAAPDLAVTKSDGGASVVPGTSVTYTLSYANNGNQDATGVVLTETVPANTTFNPGASTAGWACAPDNNAGSTCTLAIGALAAGSNGSATYTVDVPANLPGAVTQIANSVVVADDGSNGPDPNPGDNTGSDTTPVAPPSADASIVKDDAGASVIPGNNLSYTLAIANAGPSDAVGLSVTDTIPAGLGFVSASGSGWACGEAAGVVTCTRATLAVGAAPLITLVASVPANYSGANPIVNSATVATTTSDPTPGNNTDGENTPVSAPQADLSMAKDDGGASVTPGGNVSYTLAVSNGGPSDAANVTVTDTVPAGLTFVSASGTGWACGEAAGLVTCTRATLALGAAPAITLVLNVPANYAGANPIVNSATVATTTTDPAPGNDTDSDTTPVNAPSADLSLVKDDAGASVTPGSNLSYTLAVANAGLSDATAVSVTDTIPAGLGFVSATGAGWACGEAAGLVTCTRATLVVGAAPVITLVVSVPPAYSGANPILNSGTVAATTADPTPGNNTDGESTPVNAPSANLSMVKDDGGVTVVPGNNLSYTLSVGNAGPSAAANVSVTDTIPAGLGFVSASGAGWACGEVAGLVTCTRAALAVGAAPVITLVVSVPSNYAGANPIVNSSTVTSTTTDPTPGDNTDGENTPVAAPSADLSLLKDDAGASVTPGSNLSYTLAVSNAGPSDAASPSVTDTIPAGLTFVSATGAGWACGEAAGLVTCTRATLAVGAAPVITLVVAVPANYAGANPILNSGTVGSTTADPTPGNNTDGESTPVNAPSANLAIVKDDGGVSVAPGNNLTYTLSVSNAGPSDATALSVTDTIPAGLGFVSATGAGWACGQAAGVVTCTRPTLAVGAAPVITLVLSVPSNYAGANPIVNSSTVGSTTSDPTPGDNTDSETTPVTAPSADLNILKDDAGATVVPGTSLSYTLAVANAGPSDATTVSVTDTIPAGLTFVSATGAGWACGEVAGLVTCTRAALAVGAAPAITLVLGVPAGYAGADPILNSVNVGAATSDPNPGDNTDGESTPLAAPQSDLSIDKDDGGASVTPGGNLSYALVVNNAGPSQATGVSVTDTIPAGLSFVSASGTGWACGQAAGLVTCTRATLALGPAPTITLVLGVPSNYAGANPIVNSASVASTSTDPTPGNNTDSDTTPVNAASADLSLLKDDGGASVTPGNNLTYTLSVANAGLSDATAVSVTDTIPAGLGFVSATGAGWACGEAAGVVTCTRPTLAVGAAPAITLVLSVPANYAGANPILNSATVVATTADPTPGDNTDGESTPVNAASADLNIAKDDGGASVVPGNGLTYTLSVANVGPSVATAVSVTDTIPAGLGFVSATGAGWACGEAAGVVTCTRPTLAVGAAPAITLVLSVPANYAGANPIVNSATVGSTTADPTPGDNTDSDTTPVSPPSADLNIAKDDGGATVVPGNNVTYSLSVANAGPSDATALSVTDTIPAGLGFVSATGAGWACGQAAGVVTCTRPSLAVGAAPAITLVLSVPANYAGANPIVNAAAVASTTADPTPGDNTDSDTTPVGTPQSDLSILKDDAGASVTPGSNLSYTLSVANAGPSDANTLSVTDTIPAGLGFVSATGAGWACGQAAGIVTCTRPTLAVGAAPVITLVLSVPANYAGANPILNAATVGSASTDPNPGNNTDGESTPVNAASADLNIVKDDGGATVVPGNNVTYTLSVSNVGPSDAAALSVTDTIPAGLGFVSATGAGWACGQAAGVVTCTRPTLAVGAAPAITLVLSVPANYAGANPIVNSAAVASTTADPTPGDNTDSDTTPVGTPQSDLSILKDDAGASVTPGSNLSYTLSVANAGPSDANTLSVTDTIPAGLGFVSATGAGWACGQAAGVVTCTRPTLAVGAAPVITLVVSVPANYAGANPILNSATVGSASTDPNPGDNTDGESTPVNAASADLNIVKDDGGATVVPGNNVTYTLAVTNLGPSDAAALSVTDTIPAGLGFVSATGTGWACGQAAGVVTCTRPTLAVGAAPAITLVLSVPANYAGANPIVNAATVTSGTTDPTPGDNTDSDTTPVGTPQSDLSILKDDAGASVTPGSNLSYTLSVANAGPSDANTLSVTDTIPAGLGFISATGAGWACGQAAGIVTCTRPTLAVGAAPVITLVLSVPANYAGANPILNSATVGSASTDPNPGDNTDGESTPVNAASADLNIVKDDAGATAVPGGNLSYTLAVSNVGPSDATALSVTDTIPAGLGFVSANGAGWACGQAAGVVTCTRPTLAVGAAPVITLVLSLPSNYAGANPILNSATVAASTADPTPGDNTDGESTPVGASSADLAIAKDDGGATVVPGNNVTYTLDVTNLGPSDASGLSVTDTVPAGLGFVSASGAGWACGEAAGVVTCTRPTLALGAAPPISVVFSVPANYAGANPIVNSATVAATTADPTPGNNTDGDTTPVGANSADLAIVKDDGGVSVLPGNNVSYTLDVTNLGPSDASGLSVTDTVPAGLGFVSATGAGWTCGQAAGVVTCTRATLAVGAAPTISVVFSVPAGYAGANPIVNSATVASTSADPNPGNNTDGDTTPVGAGNADLSIDKDDAGVTAVPGANLSYTLAVANAGPSDAASVSVSDAIPAGLSFVSAAGTGWTCGQAAGTVTCTRPTLPVGAAPPITLVLNVAANYAGANPILNSANVSAATTDPNPGNNTDGETTPVGAGSADLAITKSDGGASVAPGANVTYTLAVSNLGPSDAVGVSVSDPIPAGLTFVSANGAGWTCGQAAGVVTCTLPTLAVGVATPITLVLGVPASYAGANPIANTATVSATTADPNAGNNSGSDTTPLGAASADLAITKSDGGASVLPGGNITYTLAVTNIGPSNAAVVSVADTIPTGLTFVSATGAGWTCGQAAGIVTCTLPTLALGPAPAITLVLGVPAAYAGPNPIPNTATVTSTTPDPVPGNNTGSDTTPVGSASADLAITKTDGGVSVAPGANVVYTLVITNNGPSDAVAVSVADATPAGTTFVSNTGDCTTPFPCALGTLASGQSRTITTTITVGSGFPAPGTVTNIATVSSTTPDTVPGNNTATETTPVGVGTADLVVVKTGPASVVQGTNATWQIVVRNQGPSDALAVVLTDATPPGLTYVSSTAPCASGFPCTLGTLAAGASVTVNVTFAIPSPYYGAIPLVNRATVTSITPDPNPDDNTDTVESGISTGNRSIPVDDPWALALLALLMMGLGARRARVLR